MWGSQKYNFAVQYIDDGKLKNSPPISPYKKRQKWDTFWRQNEIFYIPYK